MKKNPQASLRSVARALSISPATLSLVLAGKRSLGPKLAHRLCDRLGLSPERERSFMQSLAIDKAQTLERIAPELRTLTAGPRSPARHVLKTEVALLDEDKFALISDWFNYAILEMPRTKGFKLDQARIASELGITQTQVKLAVERLVKLGLFKRKGDAIIRTEARVETSDKSRTSSALRQRQRQILEKSIESLERDPIEERIHRAMTFAIREDRIPEARRKVEEFVQSMSEILDAGPRDRVYELAINLFPLQRKKASRS